jgi:hypothetical protein
MSESNIKQENQNALSHQYLTQILRYDKDSGKFYWKVQRSVNAQVGYVAGSVHQKLGYTFIQINGIRYSAHRLAWFYVYKEWPTGVIDHIDQNSTNNRIDNLRVTTQSGNMQNGSIRKDNSSGVPGVGYMSSKKCWRARINVQGKEIHIGTYLSKEEAVKARREAEKRYFI